MKKLFIAAMSLAFFASCTAPQSAPSTSVAPSSSLAYINVERVLSECDLFQSEGLPLQQRTEVAQKEWAQKEQKFQSDLASLQQKYQKGLITTANAQKEQKNIEDKVVAYRTATQKQATELDEENTVFANRAQKMLFDAVKSVNEGNKYSMIVNATALIDADSTLDISTVVLDEINKLYKQEKK